MLLYRKKHWNGVDVSTGYQYFLEILLQQEKSAACKAFIQKHLEHIYISDFSLHSIGVITFRQHKSHLFRLLTQDLLPHIQALSLPVPLYPEFESLSSGLHLDFDDAYQYLLARQFHLTLVTLDKDFKHLTDINIQQP